MVISYASYVTLVLFDVICMSLLCLMSLIPFSVGVYGAVVIVIFHSLHLKQAQLNIPVDKMINFLKKKNSQRSL